MIFTIYIIILILAILFILYRTFSNKLPDMKDKHIVITGGSSGLGIAIAQEALNLGASRISLIARNIKNLNETLKILKYNEKQHIEIYSADVTNYESIQNVFEEIKKSNIPIDYLFANAGFAKPGLFLEMNQKDFNSHIDVNYLGAAYTTKFCYPLMSKNSHIIYSGSVCSIMSFAGYAGYSPSKYALKGLADTVRNEFKSNKINTHLLIISPMDSPGYKNECLTKPEVCSNIEGTATLFTPEQITKKTFKGIANNDFIITMEFLSWILTQISYGISPPENLFAQLLIAPFIPLIRYIAVFYIDFLSRNINQKKNKND